MSDLQPAPKTLKQDMFGRVELIHFSDSCAEPQLAIRRDINSSWRGLRWAALYLAHRELKALERLQAVPAASRQLPKMLQSDAEHFTRSYIHGQPLHLHRKPSPVFFDQLKQLLADIHAAGVTHNDLAKEPNILVCSDGRPALIDFQLASCSRWFFKMQCREDLRHILKHQFTYQPDSLSQLELKLLTNKALPAKLWMACVKPVYLFITRRVFNWSDREGAGDRGAD
ncbi:MAG: serine/threonine protein kinase [Planctomycetes bacterium]|nr:serine/threonine protein kinase [Planctomycetota bacterium]